MPIHRSILPALLLTACVDWADKDDDNEPVDTGDDPVTDTDNDTGEDTGIDPNTDADGDGWTVGDGDCDDDNAEINPDAIDYAGDEIDDDCDGVDGDDQDGDGYASTVSGGDDCDDESPFINPGAEEIYYDGIDQDCDGGSDYDADQDGHDSEDYEGDDCDDSDGSTYPGAYDEPNDGIDGDCDGEDREFDGLVLHEDGSAYESMEFDLTVKVDLAVLLDTTGSMGESIYTLDLADVESGLAADLDDLQLGYATYDDYAYEPYGTASVGDRPFILQHQISDDSTSIAVAVDGTAAHYGGDAPESTMEALYQAMTGAGYDQGCDAGYDSDADVLPFLASSSDPFAGSGGETYDSSLSGGGSLGGMGFREGAQPIVAYITDNILRDPDAGDGTPGGCHLDAGHSDVITAASDLGAILIGIQVGTYDSLEDQMNALAEDSNSLGDVDGDGVHDEPLVYWIDASDVNETLVDAVNAIDGFATTYDEVVLRAADDEYGLIDSISPESYTEVDVEATSSLSFEVSYAGNLPATDEAQTLEISLDLVGDGIVLETRTVSIEVPPAD
jgi:hypothetical protein